MKHADESMTAFRRWLIRPQRMLFRRVVFQLHLWAGVIFGLYIFFISVTGSVLVYRNEFYAAAETATEIWLVSTLIELHADLLGGRLGRLINGLGAVSVIFVASTGLIIWWPGIARWKRSLTLRRGIGWKRFIWDLHSAIGFWSYASIIVFSISGIYLVIPETFHALADRLEPLNVANAGQRLVDDVLYWTAFLHFGRINGIGLSCTGPGVCDQTVKAIWALFGAAPAVMFATGATMWWNRVLRRWLHSRRGVN